MKPDKRFLKQPKPFWAYVRTISQHQGYTDRATKKIKVYGADEMTIALADLGLEPHQVMDNQGRLTSLGKSLRDYFSYRAAVLNDYVEPLLMDVTEAKKAFGGVRRKMKSARPIPMNKQKGKKKAPAYLTGMVNLLIEANAENMPCDYDPRALTTITVGNVPLRTLARRVDGAFPSPINPIAVWEIKEYYYTTTFGSRVADGVYETLLDGMELEELNEHEGVHVKHYLILDSHYTWWECGRSYLCRIIDMLHMGYVDEVLFGREVLTRVPALTQEWVSTARKQSKNRVRTVDAPWRL